MANLVTVRQSIHETNSSSSHALVVGKNHKNNLLDNKVKFKFRIHSYEFGRNYGVYTDAPHKFAYIFQFLSEKIIMPDLDSLPRNLSKKKYSEKEKELRERFDRLKNLLELVCNWIEDKTKILIDFSDLEIYPDGTMSCAGKVRDYDFSINCGTGAALDAQLDEYFELTKSAEIINRILDTAPSPIEITELRKDIYGKKDELQLNDDGRILVNCFSRMLDFAFDENSILMTADDSSSNDRERERLICEYVVKNHGYCIISWLWS